MKKVKESPLHTLKMIAACLLFVIGSYAINESEGSLQEQTFNKVIGWIGILFFGMGAILGIYKLITNKPQLIINDLGIWKPSSIFSKYKTKDVIKWEEIKNVSIEKGQSYVYIETEYDMLEIKTKDLSMSTTKLINLIDKNRAVN